MDVGALQTPPSLLARIPRAFGGKMLLLITLAPILTACYYLPQWTPILAHRQIPTLAVDRWVPFQPGWVWPYMSMYVLILLAPGLATTRDRLWRYGVGMAGMFAACGAFFFLCPIAYPRPPLPAGADFLYAAIVGIDRPMNSLPSLHAGMTVYSMLFARRVLGDVPRARRHAVLLAGIIWSGLILYGTLATKQHYFVDLPTGALVAWGADRFAWRRRRSDGERAVSP